MTNSTVAIPVDTLRKFVELTNLLSQVGEVAREITEDVTDPQKTTPPTTFLLNAENLSKDLWQMHDELKAAFSDLNDQEIEKLVDTAVRDVRKRRAATKA